MEKAVLLALSAPFVLAGAPTASIEIDVSVLRNTRGDLQACLTREARYFPDCSGDPRALHIAVPATVRQMRLSGVSPGSYAVSVFHDENANRKLDKFAGIPKEGFGFSRNPRIRFGPPRFDRVSIELTPGFTRTSVRMQYLL